MARTDVEKFLEAAPVPLGLPVTEVELRLGRAERVLEKDGHPIGFQYPNLGVWLACEEGAGAAVSFLAGGPEARGAVFPGTLPGGLLAGDEPARIAELFGEPDRAQDVPLARPPHAKLHLAFYELSAPATLSFAGRSRGEGRIETNVLATRRA